MKKFIRLLCITFLLAVSVKGHDDFSVIDYRQAQIDRFTHNYEPELVVCNYCSCTWYLHLVMCPAPAGFDCFTHPFQACEYTVINSSVFIKRLQAPVHSRKIR